jgi:hypothetical protein
MSADDPSGKLQPFSIEDGAQDPEGAMENVVFDEDQVGNTLPSVEEARETIPHRSIMAPAKRNRILLYAFMAFGIVALVITTVLLAVDLEKANEAAKNEAVKNEAETLTHKEELLKMFIDQKISTEESLRTSRSSQNQALNYMAEEETSSDMSWLYSDSDMSVNMQRIVERYVLALLFFEFNGDKDWLHDYNFLSPQDHCNWNAVFAGGMEGVTSCNAEGHVSGLELGKSKALGEVCRRPISL